MLTPLNRRDVLCVITQDQRRQYDVEFDGLRRDGVNLLFEPSAEEALEQVGELHPDLVIVGMETDTMEGLEFVARLMTKYRDQRQQIIVLPEKDDPFSPTLQVRDPDTGHSRTEQIEFGDIAALLHVPKAAASGTVESQDSFPVSQALWQAAREAARDSEPPPRALEPLPPQRTPEATPPPEIVPQAAPAMPAPAHVEPPRPVAQYSSAPTPATDSPWARLSSWARENRGQAAILALLIIAVLVALVMIIAK